MKYIKSSYHNECAVNYKMFLVAKDSGVYKYFLRFFWRRTSTWLIYKSTKKNVYLNKYTLTLLAILANVFLLYPYMLIVAIIAPFYNYFIGMKYFIQDGVWVENVRYFNWVNFIATIILSLILILK